MTKRNHEVHADSGLDSDRLFRVLTVLDIEAGANFIRRTELSSEEARYIKHGLLPDICGAENRPLPMVGTVRLRAKLGTFVIHVELIVCQSLAAPVILGGDFFDRFIEAIRVCSKLVES